MVERHTQFKALRDATRPLHQIFSRNGRTGFSQGFREEPKPPVKVHGIHWQRCMLLHGRSVIPACHQGNG